MKRMISPELFQLRGSNHYEETFREHINSEQREDRKSASGRHSFSFENINIVSGQCNSASDKLEDSVFEDDQSIHANDNFDHGITDRPRDSFGTISTQSARRTGTTVPPQLDAIKQSETSNERTTAISICECGCMHPTDEDLRRRSTGSSPTSYDEKQYYLGSGSEVLGERRNSNRHGKYSLVYDDNYVMEAMQCCRYRMRRNALCDPFRLPMPQKTRERLEKDNEKRKSSVTRKVSQFFTIRLDLNREEDLL